VAPPFEVGQRLHQSSSDSLFIDRDLVKNFPEEKEILHNPVNPV
jgi:hypothetical protein